jgi:uncharacterized protein
MSESRSTTAPQLVRRNETVAVPVLGERQPGRASGGTKPVVVFFVLAYGLSWAWVIPWVAAGRTVFEGRGWPTHLPSLVGPLLAAFAVTGWTEGSPGVRALWSRMGRWRIGWRWWLAVASPLLCFLGVLSILAIIGEDLPARADFARISGIPSGFGIVGVAVVVTVVDGFGEETGWRGYALPHLQRRFGPIVASLIIASLWAGWHIPQFFLLHSYKGFSVEMLPVFVVGLTSGAIVWTWIYNRTGSVLAVAVWHGIYNVTGGTQGATSGSGAIAAVMWTFVVIHAMLLLALERRASRANRPSMLCAR